MDAPEPAVTFRVRPFWEAADTGILLFRRWPLAAGLLTLGPTAVLAALFWGLFGTSVPWLPPLLLWWFRPLTDRLLLAWVGGRFFQPDEAPRAGLVRCLRAFDGALAADLTWRRFHFWADALAPVSLLERVDRSQRRARRRWLAADLRGQAFGLAASFLVIESVVGGLLWASGSGLDSLGLWGAASWQNPLESGAGWTLLVAAVQVGVSPFFALGSFGLYVNARTRKEGWDLALTFRTQRRRLSPGAFRAPLLLLVLALAAPPAARAEGYEPPPAAGPLPATGQTWAEVTAGPEFGRTETQWTWKLRKPSERKAAPEGNFELPPVNWSAELLRTLAVGTAAVLVLTAGGWLGWRAWQRRSAVRPGTAGAPEVSPNAAGLDEALRLWRTGDQRAALALLYRTSLAVARSRFQVDIPAQATEQDCLRALSRLAPAAPEWAPAFGDLVALWSETAWAGRPASSDRFESAVEALRRVEGGRR